MGKEVTLENGKFINAYNTLNQLLLTAELSRQVNWNLGKNLDRLEAFYKRYSKCQTDILNKFVLRDESNKIRTDENGEPLFAPRRKNEYMNEMNELLECLETIDFLTVKLTDIPEKVKAINLHCINFMIDDSE